jgi:hypothetical protein
MADVQSAICNLKSAIQNLASELKKFVVNQPHSSFLLAAQEQRLVLPRANDHSPSAVSHQPTTISHERVKLATED